eukprot:6101719-Amphidinium_carterae.2
MGPVGTQIGTQFSVSSEIPGANPHITSSQAPPTIPALTTQVLTPGPSDHQPDSGHGGRRGFSR